MLLVRIAIFDSGLGSLSIIKSLQKKFKCEIIYFADQHNFPYGTKSKKELDIIIRKSISYLKKNYSPDIIVMASNTPSLLLDSVETRIIKVTPPIIEASKLSKTNNIGILATESAINSKGLENFVKKSGLRKKNKIHKINASSLVNLVESGKFLTNKKLCRTIIQKELGNYFYEHKIDVVTLSSTHLPFLKSFFNKQFPDITFLDPSDLIAETIFKKRNFDFQKRNKMKIITTGNAKKFEKILLKQGIKNKPYQIPYL
ncbi:Glutamate racemase protein [Marine Group I thaumarchaeote SCGC AAA799-E16]|uniref:Glutamate racemase protein n=2 Tax=Marine Group I TaxID=905826 RepID=A0A087S4Z7_9ARCH|nr:Glutamate racemase protein [Marine Group I thaumarchaeote SCGC AAA799-E16]KFM20801.1 Glutamate racemase protein [Marine Group I thaumarchaeote SCGC RSA3]